MKSKAVIFALLLVSVAGRAQGQSGGSQNFRYIDSLAQFEAIPTDPVLDMMNVATGQMSQPGTPSALLATLLPISDLKGRLKPAFAVGIAPYQLFAGTHLQLRDYVENWGTRFLSNSQVSIGTAPTKQIDSSLDFGIGVRLMFFNSGDGRLNKAHIDSLVSHAIAILEASPLPNDPRLIPAAIHARDSLVQINNKMRQTEAKESGQERWNATYLELDMGTVFRASQSLLSKSAHDRTQFWLNGGSGLGIVQAEGQFGVLLRNANREFYGPDSATSIVAALQVRIGNPNFRLGVGSKLVGSATTLAGSIETRVAENAWLYFTLSRQVTAGLGPTPWAPSFSIRTTMGNYGL